MINIVTIAVNKRAYGEMAFNLAVSLKCFFPDSKITVISDGRVERIPHFEKVIDSIVKVPEGQNAFELKTRLNLLTPYEKTLYIDADSIFIADPILLFHSLNKIKFAAMEYRRHEFDSVTNPVWAKVPEIFSHYNLGEGVLYPEYNSSVLYWEKSDKTDLLFETANNVYHSPPCKLLMNVGGSFPDEIAFGVASAKTGVYSEIPYWEPAFLQTELQGNPINLKDSFSLLTMAGGESLAYSKREYDSTIQKAAKILGLPHFKFEAKNKVHYART